MFLIWTALFILTASWLFLTQIFQPVQWGGYVLLILGIVLFCIGLKKQVKISMNKASYLLFIPLIISCFLFPFPFNSGFFVLIIALTIYLLNKTGSIRSVTQDLILLGIILLFQALFFPVYYWLAPQHHNLQIFTPVLYSLLKLTGYGVYFQNNSLLIETSKGIINFTTTLEKSGFDFAIILLIGAGTLIFISNSLKRWNKIGIALVITFLYLIIRSYFLIVVYLYSYRINIFWDRWIIIISFIPLLFLFTKFIKIDGNLVIPLQINYNIKQLRAVIFMFLGSFLLLFGLFFQDPGIKKQGRVLIDEKHSDWEWTTQKFDTTWYGEKSSYNYYCLYNYINHYYKVERNLDSITPQILNKYDILIIKTPTSAYSSHEIKTIIDFVENGGSLFLIGDHTNVFGTSTYLNPIARKFGFTLNYDSTHDLSTGNLTFFEPSKYLSHPVIQNFGFFLFGTSCTLSCDASTENIITGYGLKSLVLDYSKKNFFSDIGESAEMPFGLFTQMAGAKKGKGRVLIFTDSTVFSNFWMFMSGKPELFLGSLNWLNRQNFFGFLNNLFLISGIAFCILFFILQKKYRKASILYILLLMGNAGICTGIFSSYLLNKAFYALPVPHTEFKTISFDLEHSDIELPNKELTGNAYSSYSTFYVWTQRVDMVPKTDYSLDQAMNTSDIICIINPVKKFSKNQLQNLFNFISNGGNLFLMDNLTNSESTSEQLLQMFSMHFEKQILNQNFEFDDQKNSLSFIPPYLIINGGSPLIFNSRKQSIANIMQIGKGKVLVFSDSYVFCDAIMGYSNSFPNENQIKIYTFEYKLLNEILSNLNE